MSQEKAPLWVSIGDLPNKLNMSHNKTNRTKTSAENDRVKEVPTWVDLGDLPNMPQKKGSNKKDIIPFATRTEAFAKESDGGPKWVGRGGLPDEIWLKILGYLVEKEQLIFRHQWRNLLKMATVCKKMSLLVQDAALYREISCDHRHFFNQKGIPWIMLMERSRMLRRFNITTGDRPTIDGAKRLSRYVIAKRGDVIEELSFRSPQTTPPDATLSDMADIIRKLQESGAKSLTSFEFCARLYTTRNYSAVTLKFTLDKNEGETSLPIWARIKAMAIEFGNFILLGEMPRISRIVGCVLNGIQGIRRIALKIRVFAVESETPEEIKMALCRGLQDYDAQLLTRIDVTQGACCVASPLGDILTHDITIRTPQDPNGCPDRFEKFLQEMHELRTSML